MKTTDFLDKIKKKHGIESDYKLAQVLGVTRGAVSIYRQRGNQFDNLVAMRAAELLDMDARYIVAICNLNRAKSPEEKKLWRSMADSFDNNKKERGRRKQN